MSERGLGEGDRRIFEDVAAGRVIPITSPEQFKAMAKAARKTKEAFDDDVSNLTQTQAEYVYALRVKEGYSWRAVAEACYLEWDGDWSPPSNQLMGMALCEAAARFWGQDYMEPPWN